MDVFGLPPSPVFGLKPTVSFFCPCALTELVLVCVKHCLFPLLSLNVTIFIGIFRCLTVNESWHRVTTYSQCLHSVVLIDSYRSACVGCDGAAFHWGIGCVTNVTWNNPGTANTHHCGKIRLKIFYDSKGRQS